MGFRKDSSEEERLHPPPPQKEGAWGKRWSSLWKGFLSPTRGTEGVIKTIDKEEFEKAFLNDKEGRVGFRKTILSVVVFSASQRREEEK